MCLTAPGRVLELDGATAIVDLDGRRRACHPELWALLRAEAAALATDTPTWSAGRALLESLSLGRSPIARP